MPGLVFTPTDFVAVFNQTLEAAYPSVAIEGELAEFRVSKNRWVYFKLRDDLSSIDLFGSIYQLPGPLEDGMVLRVQGAPRLHPRFGFSISYSSITPVGEGSLKKAADLLRAKLTAEGLFAPERKRFLPPVSERVGLITSAGSAAEADFIKVLNSRWGGVDVQLIDVLVQGEQAPAQIIQALEQFNQLATAPDVVVLIRGGGSAEDLAAFNDERVVRAVAASRAPTLVAIGHEVDESLTELAADVRASTPTAAAARLVPDKAQVLSELKLVGRNLAQSTKQLIANARLELNGTGQSLKRSVGSLLQSELENLQASRRVIAAFNPAAVVARGYVIIERDGVVIAGVEKLAKNDHITARMRDGKLKAKVEQIDA